ncbi:MAG TPA: S8 family serine peptidase [Gammaproteobacteria bacterium]|nr:S8 family serine peptidase [Gammaproteobacteria bacterium]
MRALIVAAAVAVFSLVGITSAQTGVAPVASTRALRAHRIQGPVAPYPHPGQAGATARYIVRFKDAPVALYTGGISGLRATSTRATDARHLDMRASRLHAYVHYLDSRHTEFMKQARTKLGRTLKPRFQYRYALNGMSVNLSRAEAAKLARMADVVSVQPVRYYRPQISAPIPATAADTFASRSWIGAPAVWADTTFGGLDNEGEGIVVADVDTGINSGNSSFAATGPKDGYVTQNPLGSGVYLGVCDPADTGQAANKPAFFSCNDKLIGAYTYTSGTNDPDSPEDSEGHGSHTASTMAGNFVDVSVLGSSTPISGMAPHANIIAYDVCDPTDLCGSDASVSAVDQAIKDYATLSKSAGFNGMVLNYSIGGGSDPYNDDVELAFLSAVEAGIYVSTSGGNGGPGNTSLDDPTQLYPVEHLGPWVASTAASTHNGVFGDNNVTGFAGGDLTTRLAVPDPITGEGITGSLALSDIVYAGDGGYSYANYPTDSAYSTSNTYTLSGENYADPTQFSDAMATAECLYPFPAGTFAAGSIVVCDRGDIPLVDKADNVKQGGAAGIVIVSQSGNALIAEPYEVPGTMIANADGLNLEAWLNASAGSGTAQAELTGSSLTTDATGADADQLADFSSRGPNNSVYDSVIKPDLTAPGVSVLAAVSNPIYTDGVIGGTDQPESYDFYDGTSMASPHDAGAGALLMQLHPGWTPAEIKSAMMLTAVTAANGTSPGLTDQCASLDTNDNCIPGTSVPSPQVRGAGRIDLDAASRSGLVLDENAAHYKAANPDNGGDLTKLNLASLGNNDCIQSCTWTRTVTSALANTTAQYSVSVSDADSGLKVTVSPASFSLAPGATQILTVAADVSGLSLKKWAFAQVDITSSGNGDDGQPIPAMHLPLAVQPEQPEPIMSVSPTSLSLNVMQTQTTTQDLAINNSGLADLNWIFSTSSGSQASSLWDQPDSGNGSGVPSGYFSPDAHGVYSSDHFAMPVKGTITEIFADGFAQDGAGPIDLTTAGAIDWYIYADKNGQPAGNPDDGLKDYLWHFSSLPTGAGVDTTDGNITLDLSVAGQAAISLSAGTYWLIVSPTFNAEISDPNGAAWYWLEGKSADGQNAAMLIDPSNAFGNGVTWQASGDSLAFMLTGTLDCSGGSLTGLSFSEQSGTIKAGASETVTASFYAAAPDAGSYTAGLCITGNDPLHPLIAVPVLVTVTEAPHSSGGGLGPLGLLMLGLLGWRRRTRN